MKNKKPCEDAISRQAVLDGIDTYINKAQSTGTQDDFYSFAELVVKELPSVTPKAKVGKWIPVSERLPELGEAVLTYHEDDEEYQINWVTDDETVEWFYENPIAWMPLPEPYKAESEDK